MGNTKKEFLLKFITEIDNEGIIDAIEEVIESSLFVEKVKQRTGLMPVWVVYQIHISQIGARYLTDISKAFRSKKGISDYIYSNIMAGNKITIESQVIFIDQHSDKIFYSTKKNNLGYYNYNRYYTTEAAARSDSSTDIEIKEKALE